MAKENLSEKVYKYIIDQLFTGELRGGDRIVEEALVELLGISRTPVREAIRRLQQEGLLSIYPRRYAEVVRLDRKDLEKIGLIRIELLSLACRLAVWRGSNSDFERLNRAAEAYGDAVSRGTYRDLIERDVDFYRILAGIGGNEYLYTMLRELDMKIKFIQYSRALEGGGAPAAQTEHEDILEALFARDADAAEFALASHLGAFYNIDPQFLKLQRQK